MQTMSMAVMPGDASQAESAWSDSSSDDDDDPYDPWYKVGGAVAMDACSVSSVGGSTVGSLARPAASVGGSSCATATTSATNPPLVWPYTNLKRNSKEKVGLTERLAKHASALGYGDVADALRADEAARRARDVQDQRRAEAARDFEITRLKAAAAAAKEAARRRVRSAGDDSSSFASTMTDASGSARSGSTGQSAVVRVGARARQRPASAAVSVSSRGSSRSRASSSGDWYVASAGPYVDPQKRAALEARKAKARFVGSAGGFVSAFGRASHMRTRAPGGVAASGPYCPKACHSTKTGLAAPPAPTASFSKTAADPMKRPKGAKAAWAPIADRSVPKAKPAARPGVV